MGERERERGNNEPVEEREFCSYCELCWTIVGVQPSHVPRAQNKKIKTEFFSDNFFF